MRPLDLHNPDTQSESGSRRTKMTHKNREVITSFFGSAGCSLFKAEGFF
jgi:hypothetical protein